MSWKINELQQQVPLVAPRYVRLPALFCVGGFYLVHPTRPDRPNVISQRGEFSCMDGSVSWEVNPGRRRSRLF